MANRRRRIYRQPRTSAAASACISIMPDGSVDIFKPKRKQPNVYLERNKFGKFEIHRKARDH